MNWISACCVCSCVCVCQEANTSYRSAGSSLMQRLRKSLKHWLCFAPVDTSTNEAARNTCTFLVWQLGCLTLQLQQEDLQTMSDICDVKETNMCCGQSSVGVSPCECLECKNRHTVNVDQLVVSRKVLAPSASWLRTNIQTYLLEVLGCHPWQTLGILVELVHSRPARITLMLTKHRHTDLRSPYESVMEMDERKWLSCTIPSMPIITCFAQIAL
jgi:hypothetical protein